MSQHAKFLEGNLLRHVTVMALTASIGLMAVFVVDFVDMVFISMLGKAELAAAVGYAGAILFFTTSFGIGMAIAAGALVARALGQGDTDMARRRSATALIYGIAVGAVFALLVWLNLDRLARLVGASGETHDLAVHYLQIIVPSLPLLLIGMVGGAILRAHGDARRAMLATVIAGAVNAALDPILIFGLGLDLTGAALASVVARVAMAGFALRPIFVIHGGLANPGLDGLRRDFRAIVAIAGPAILTQFATPLGQAYVTRAMAQFGEDAVAGMAIIGRMAPVAFAVIFALSGAVGPIIGQNYGARRYDRVRRAYADGMLFALVFIVAMSGLLYLMRGPVAALFQVQGMALTLLYLFCGPLALAFFFNAMLFVSNAAFNNLGHPLYSTALNWLRHTLGTIPPVMIGAAWFGAPGVLIGQALGGVLFGVLAWIMVGRLIARKEAPRPSAPFGRQARQMVLFNRRR